MKSGSDFWMSSNNQTFLSAEGAELRSYEFLGSLKGFDRLNLYPNSKLGRRECRSWYHIKKSVTYKE